MNFVGREHDLDVLRRLFEDVRRDRRGVMVAVRGRRQVGKSTLVEQFLERTPAPSVFLAAARGASSAEERAELTRLLAASDLTGRDRFDAVTFDDWRGLLRALADAVDAPSIVVIDELPWLLGSDPGLEGVLQAVWDRSLSKTPLLLILIGSAVSMMEALAQHGRPLYGRLREVAVAPLTVADTAAMLDLRGSHAFDAQLVTGGYPRLLADWRPGASVGAFLREQLADATSPLVVVGERMLQAEFPEGLQARDVLRAVGGDEAGFSRLRDRSGLNQGSLARSLRSLVEDARVLRAERPLSARRSQLVRYVVADTYLRFWLRWVLPAYERVLRGRGEQVAEEIVAGWPDWRGRAVEPLVREGVERLLPDPRLGSAAAVGAWWDRHEEVDLVGADAATAPAEVAFVGSVKWRDRRGFGREDARDLAAARARIPGAASALLVGVSAAGFRSADLDLALTADDLLAAWRP